MTAPPLLIALATELEKEGQYNAAKLLRRQRQPQSAANRPASRCLGPAEQADLLEGMVDHSANWRRRWSRSTGTAGTRRGIFEAKEGNHA